MKFILNIIISFIFIVFLFSQSTVNGIAVVVGDYIITHADVYQQLDAMKQQSAIPPGKEKEFENLLINSLIDRFVLLSFAEKDSLLFVEDDEVSDQLNIQIDSFVQRAGSIENVEEYFGKKIEKIKSDFWKEVYENILIEKYKYSIVGDVSVEKKEVELFYEKYKDSIPNMPANANVDIINIPFTPSNSTIEKKISWLETIKDSIENNYISLDKAVASHSNLPNNGNVGYTERGTLFEEYEIAAFSSEVGALVGPIKTSAGLHLIKILDKRGEKIKTQHLLIPVLPTDEDKRRIVEKINSYYEETKKDPLFIEIHLKENFHSFGFSGIHEKIYLSSFPEDLSQSIKKSKEGEVFGPMLLSDGTIVLGKLHEFFKESKPTLHNSYNFLTSLAKEEKQNNFLSEWLSINRQSVYVENFINK